MKTIYIGILSGCVFLLVGCKKFVEVGQPETQLPGSAIFSSDATATAAQLAVYAAMESDGLAYNMILNTGLSADELINYSTGPGLIDLSTNNLTADNAAVFTMWTQLYKYIYQANNVLEGVRASSVLSAVVSKQLQGEAKFVRAFGHFYLLRLFGEVPIIRTTDYRINAILPRNRIEEVYTFIEQDLNEAIMMLSGNYLSGINITTSERVRPNKWTAAALLARLQLHRENWLQAEAHASAVIAQSSSYNLVADLNSVFLKNSKEAIWQWMAVVPRYNSFPGASLILTTTPSASALDTNFVKGFRPGDSRPTAWINSITVAGNSYYYPFKYKVGQNASSITEYTMVFRLSEQYLIRAEARAKQGNLQDALNDLNAVRTRAGLSSLSSLTQQALVDSIHTERKYELFTEFGDRWFNLQRTGTADAVMTALKGTNWSSTDKWYPIPQTERNRNPYLSQNAGY